MAEAVAAAARRPLCRDPVASQVSWKYRLRPHGQHGPHPGRGREARSPRARGARAERLAPGTQVHCLLTYPTRARGPRPLTRRGPALARGEPGPLIGPVRVTRDWAALMTGCPHVCVCVSVLLLPLPQAHPGPPGPPREPTSTSASLSPASLPRPLGSEAPWRAWSGVLWTGPSHQAPLPLRGPLGNDHTGHLDGPDEVTDDVRGGPWPPRVGQVQGSGW